ncbi:MAG: DUF4396 domain-containing protein [Actinomycetota bacterium]|nr:DUF4396 domain-containing protein [Actinomycetota bacterium]
MSTTRQAEHSHHHHAGSRGDHAEHGAQGLGGGQLNRLALSATGHCLTGCVIGEVAGMVIGTSLGWSDGATIALAVGLAFLFGYALTSVPLIRAGLALGAVATTAFASDTVSIAIMETIDNVFVALVPGAMEAHLTDWLFWASIAGGFAIAFPVAFLANRYLIARGRGHALVHAHHHH